MRSGHYVEVDFDFRTPSAGAGPVALLVPAVNAAREAARRT